MYYLIKDRFGDIDPTVIKLLNPDGTVSCIPNDPENKDWRVYQEWLTAGNSPAEEV